MATNLLDLNNLSGGNGFVIRGTTRDDRLGTKVDITGDINGDGIEDIVVTSADGGDASSNTYSYNYSDRRGEAYVIFGNQNSTSAFDLNDLDGNNGFRVAGINEDDRLGSAISVGDINGDGIDDLALGAPYGGSRTTSYGYEYSRGEGRAYIIFGRQNGFAANVDVNSLNGNNGFFLGGIDAQDNLGAAITSAGDINGDGIDDLAVSAAGAGQNITNTNGYSYSDLRGETFIVFGKNNFNSNINLALLDGSDGFKIQGKDAYDRLGESLSNAGDINGDGIDDLVIGTPGAGEVLNSPYADGYSDRRGEAYVIFGQQNFNAGFNLDNLNGNNGFTVSGVGVDDNLGSAVTNAGDINGDGIDDLILGAQEASQTGEYTFEGGAYVIFGQTAGFDSQFDLTTLDGTNGFSIPGLELDDNLGNAVAVGDISGDGIDDLIVGANTAGETIVGGDSYGYSDRRGEVYIIYGKNSSFDAAINLESLSIADGGEIRGIGRNDIFGSSISSGGDVDGDGIDDLIVSAPDDNVQGTYTREGEVYVVLKDNELNRIVGTLQNDSLNGTNQSDEILGLQGDDTLNGRGGNDVLEGGVDNDLLIGGLGNDFIEANSSNDTLFGNQGDDILNGNGGRDRIVGGNGRDTLNGNEGSDTLLGGIGNDSLNGNSGNDILFGNLGDDSLNGGNNNDVLVSEDGNDTLLGGSGNDSLVSRLGNDFLDGGNDNDILISQSGDDTLLGGSGADRLVSRLGNDSLDGGQDNDTLVGGNNNDLLLGGAGSDRLIGRSGNDSLYGVQDNDTLVGGDGNDTLNGNEGEDLLNGGNNNDSLNGGDQNDVVFGRSGNDTLAGENGNDSIFAGSGNDVLSGGNDLDLLKGDAGQDTVFGGIGQDTLFGGSGNDSLDGENNADIINGDAGEDILLGGFGNDTLYGGIGNDSLNGEGDNDVLDAVETNNPNFGVNELDTLTGGSGSDIFTLGDGNEVYYDDGISNTKGINDFARLNDIDVNQDIIKMMGRINEYELNIYPNGSGGFNAEVLYNPGTYILGELIGVLENVPNDLELTDSVFAII